MAEDYTYDENRMKVRINCLGYLYGASLEDYDEAFARVIDVLLDVKKVSSVILAKEREYEYDYKQTRMLLEIAKVIENLVRQRVIANRDLRRGVCSKFYPEWNTKLEYITLELIRRDPIGAYVEVLREIREIKTRMKRNVPKEVHDCYYTYRETLNVIKEYLGATKIIQKVKNKLTGYHIGDRTLYRQIFMPTVRPNFMLTRYLIIPPKDGMSVDRYKVKDTQVEIFRLENSSEYFYYVLPPEFKLTEEKYAILDSARRYMATNKPTTAEFVKSQRVRDIFYSIGKDVITENAEKMGTHITTRDLEQLSTILTRYTAGLGVLEVLINDEKIQDLYLNAPIEREPILIYHENWEECRTNLIPTMEDAEAWATRLRIQSGRPLDEANPVLDTDLTIPGGSARFAVITRTLSPSGLGFAIRRHRDRPWTLPLFIKSKMLDPLAAGLLSFLIDGSVSMLIAGGRSAGKSSLLGSLMLEILQKIRVVTIEDTLELPVRQLRDLGYNIASMKSRSVITRVETEMPADEALRTALRLGDSAMIVGEVRSSIRGSEEVVIIDNGKTKRVPISSLGGKKLKNVYVPTIDNNLNMKLTKLTDFVKHPTRKKLLEIITKTGRKVTVTHDHSVFTSTNFTIHPIETKKLKTGDKIIIPARMPCGYNDIDYLNLLDLLPDFRIEGAEYCVKKAIKKLGWKKATEVCRLPTNDIYLYFRKKQKTRIPIKSFLRLMKEAKIKYNLKYLRIKRGASNSIPAKFPVNENIMRLIGYFLAEGNIDEDKIQITNSKSKIIKDIRYICQKEFGLKVSSRKIKGYGSSVQMFIASRALSELFIHFGCGRTSSHKRIPGFVYGLNEKKICALLKGMYSGDGSITSVKSAGNMIRYFSTSRRLAEDVLYLLLALGIVARIYKRKPVDKGNRDLFIVEFKQRSFVEKFLKEVGFIHKKPKIMIKAFPHTKDNSVVFDPEEMEKHLKLPRKYRHLRRTKQCSKYYIKRIANEVKSTKHFSDFANGEFYLDEIKKINEITLNTPEPVYDLSVNPTENFVGGFGGIILHNTEAKALYEAMRIGALSNVVAGTIHGESAYGVYDRVVNDLGVPKTSFKATDIIPIAKSLRSADGLHRFRRLTEITEVRKKWSEDPLKEGGFVNLMQYSGKEDRLKPTDTLINGESEILNRIASYVKEWSGNWAAVWENINLRGRIKQEMINISNASKRPEILEADWVAISNSKFHLISENVRKETGASDAQRIFEEWLDWFKNHIKTSIIV